LKSIAPDTRATQPCPLDALDALHLFENLDEISITMTDGREIPFRSGVVELEDSEGYARYDRTKNLIEILASQQTYDWLETRNPRAASSKDRKRI
jgi:hypothetical protein